MAGFSGSAFVRGSNGLAIWLMDLPGLGRLVRRGLVEIRYVGRRSGKTFQIPVGYRRSGDTVVVSVAMPDKKSWWRNFLGDGAPITFVGLDGRNRAGHAVATRDERGRVSVTARLDGS
jgi:hypothetical protein